MKIKVGQWYSGKNTNFYFKVFKITKDKVLGYFQGDMSGKFVEFEVSDFKNRARQLPASIATTLK